MTPELFFSEAQFFLTRLNTQLEAIDFSLAPHWDVDHICYRVETPTEYNDLKDFLASFSTELIESEVAGRPIATFELNQPILYRDREIHLVELPAPKVGKTVTTGFEHIEVVIDHPLQELMQVHPDLNWKTTGLKKAYNAELALMLENTSVKFHHYSLKSVVELEGCSKIFSALEKTQILEQFADHHPLVVGTIPLGISLPESDVDILFSSDDFAKTRARLEESYRGQYEDHQENATFRFTEDGVPFEVYISKEATTSQRAFRHYQVEERLLKYGGTNFKKQIQSLRNQGAKTEPAFASALGLTEDPYLELEALQVSNHTKLCTLLGTSHV